MATEEKLTAQEIAQVGETIPSDPTPKDVEVSVSDRAVLALRSTSLRGVRATGVFTPLHTGKYAIETTAGNAFEATGGALDDDGHKGQLGRLTDDAIYWLGEGLDAKIKELFQ